MLLTIVHLQMTVLITSDMSLQRKETHTHDKLLSKHTTTQVMDDFSTSSYFLSASSARKRASFSWFSRASMRSSSASERFSNTLRALQTSNHNRRGCYSNGQRTRVEQQLLGNNESPPAAPENTCKSERGECMSLQSLRVSSGLQESLSKC